MGPRAATLQTTLDSTAGTRLAAVFEQIREELDVRQAWPDAVLEEAAQGAADPQLPQRDLTHVEFITIDPPGSMDLDQALHLAPAGDEAGEDAAYRVLYAIADVPAFVRSGGLVDEQTRARGQTIYCPDTRVALHPEVISEQAASLLPDLDRPAYVWDIVLDSQGARLTAQVERAMVRSRRRYTYAEVQAAIDDGTAEQTLLLLRDVGALRIQRESERGGASLPMPEQEVQVIDGHYETRLRPLLDAEDWNAQISLLTGMVAADIMLEGGVGILRTMPPADDGAVRRLRREARALGVNWPQGLAYGDFLRTLDRTDPQHLALIHDATALFRGAGYTPFVSGEVPQEKVQAAIGAPYAHVTAPLRRLVDRFGLAICAALTAELPPPEWAVDALSELPAIMERSGHQARAVERACVNAVEAAVLQGRVGEHFAAVVVDEAKGGELVVQVTDPAISARARGTAELGTDVTVELVEADLPDRQVLFEIVEPA